MTGGGSLRHALALPPCVDARCSPVRRCPRATGRKGKGKADPVRHAAPDPRPRCPVRRCAGPMPRRCAKNDPLRCPLASWQDASIVVHHPRADGLWGIVGQWLAPPLACPQRVAGAEWRGHAAGAGAADPCGDDARPDRAAEWHGRTVRRPARGGRPRRPAARGAAQRSRAGSPLSAKTGAAVPPGGASLRRVSPSQLEGSLSRTCQPHATPPAPPHAWATSCFDQGSRPTSGGVVAAGSRRTQRSTWAAVPPGGVVRRMPAVPVRGVLLK